MALRTGTAIPIAFGANNTASTGVVRTDLDADRTLVTDQAGKRRISRTNALGQLTDVWEIVPASDASTESVTFPGTSVAYGYKTSYVYDTLNNLTTVNQGIQTRSFAYSSLSRLLTAQNPESGTISYQYDPNGNLISKTDARSITTSYVYDALNRVTQRAYSDSTLPVSYTYDDLPHAKGKLTKVTTGSGSTPFSVTEYTEFDAVGRVKKSRQATDGTVYNEMEYTYNLSGALLEEKYPSGRIVKTVLDDEGDLQTVKSQKNANQAFWNYANHFTYTAAGAVASMQLGNGAWEKTAFNSRLQPTQIALGKVQNATDLLKLDYTYGVVESSQLNTAKNNGNIQSQTITAPTITGSTGFTAVQTYNYDALNRIDDATEMVTPAGSSTAAQSWKQDYTFDRYGNRNFIEANTTTIPKYCANNSQVCPADRKVLNPSISASTNRINLEQDGDSVNDYAFDASGNTTKDANGRTFVYDAENKQIEVKNASDETIGKYWYDGDGRRVKKRGWINGQWEETIFVYDASSRLVAEYSTTLNPTPQVAYVTNDHLGSPRINTDENGKVTARHDYRPYGEEVTERTHAQYVGDTIRKQFTGYERDKESGLDFAKNRYNSGWLGRFSTPDPFKIVAEIEFEPDATSKRDKLNRYLLRPLQWNAYVYVVNNPLKYTDPTGEVIVLRGTDAQVQAALKRINDLLGDERFNLIQKSSDGRILYLNDKDICGGNFSKFSSFGPTDKDKDVSKKFAEMLASPTRVSFGIATSVQYIARSGDATKIGTVQTLDIRKDAGGGVTLAANESLSGEIEIYVAPNAADAGNRKASGADTSGMTEDGTQLRFPDNSVVDSHEFGHAYDLMFDQPANTNSLIFENARRANVKNNQRRKSEK